jgi:Na+/H+ antiporter NhaD/arsenite permease-like protein
VHPLMTRLARGAWPAGLILAGLSEFSPAVAAGGATMPGTSHPVPGLIWTLPFVVLLLAIAILPLSRHTNHWWEKHLIKLLLGLALGGAMLVHYGLRGYGFGEAAPGLPTVWAVAEHAVLREYLPFMTLLLSLYVIAGGLHLKGDLYAYPRVNTAILGLGAVLASFIGTTGASMVLIRPLLQTNRDRTHVRHTVIFFIFLVSNIGGCLLPIGDPPLFLGYLRGVPFLWTLTLWKPWLFCVGALLAIYYVWDNLALRREPPGEEVRERRHYSPLRLRGTINLVWLLGVVLAVALIVPGRPLPGTHLVVGEFVREAVMLGLAGLSLATTPRGLRREAGFGYAAILEVAALFLGIFLTMQAPIEILQVRGPELGLGTPSQFFWAAGTLSSFLDNAPTYVVFLETALSLPAPAGAAILRLPSGGTLAEARLAAISLGAVFMGANTYIGNGPNFMVKSIAEERGVPMPSFFGYMLYSVLILLPLFGVVTLLFFL